MALDYLTVVVGTFIYASGVAVFVVPNQIGIGGVTGIAAILNQLTGFPIGTATLLFNIPLLICGFLFLGRSFVVKTLVSVLTFTLFSDVLLAQVSFGPYDKMLSTLFGGLLIGLGLGMQYRRGGSTGGTDIVSRLLQKKFPRLKLGKLVFGTDLVVITAASVVFRDIETFLYAFVIVFINSVVIDYVVYGSERGKVAMINTQQTETIAQVIMEEMEHGCTVLEAKGAYSGEYRNVLLCVVARNEFYKLKRRVQDIDPDAFVIVLEASEVVGLGFEPALK